MLKTLSALLIFGFSFPVSAAPILLDCDGPAHVSSVAEPWKDATRTFANGVIRVVWVDTGGEPACCSSHLVILAPDPEDELGNRKCRILSDGAQWLGFQSVDVSGIKSSYDAGKGLLLSVPIERYIDGIKSNKSSVGVRINQANGIISIE